MSPRCQMWRPSCYESGTVESPDVPAQPGQDALATAMISGHVGVEEEFGLARPPGRCGEALEVFVDTVRVQLGQLRRPRKDG